MNSQTQPADPSERVDLNVADREALTQLPGVGPALAERIIAHRAEQPFTSPADLLRVPGIGAAAFARLADHVMAAAAPSAPEQEQDSDETTSVRPEQSLIPWAESRFGLEKRERDWQGLLITGAVSVLLGALIALAALAGMNRGSLLLNQQSEVVALTGQAEELANRAAALESETETLRTRLSALEGLTGRMDDAEEALADVEGALTELETSVADLDERSAALAEDVESVRGAAERFDVFLDGLRALLGVEGAPDTTQPESTPAPSDD